MANNFLQLNISSVIHMKAKSLNIQFVKKNAGMVIILTD